MKQYFVVVFDPNNNAVPTDIERADYWNWTCTTLEGVRSKAEALARQFPSYVVKYGRFTDKINWRNNDPYERESL